MRKPNTLKFGSLIALGLVLSALTVVLGTIPMRIVYKHWGRLAFWLTYAAVIGAIAMLALRYETNGVRMVTDEDEIAGAAGGGRRKAKST